MAAVASAGAEHFDLINSNIGRNISKALTSSVGTNSFANLTLSPVNNILCPPQEVGSVLNQSATFTAS